MTAPRGIRNNNPGNIRHSKSKWQGMADVQGDSEFVTFVSPEYGIRAICRVLLTYQKRGIDTVGEIVRTYAPPSENNTSAYIRSVCKSGGFLPDEVLDLDDVSVMLPLVKAIVKHETGTTYPEHVFENGLRLAGITGAKPKPLVASRTAQGSVVTVAGGTLAAASEVSRQLQEVQEAFEPAFSFVTWLSTYGIWFAIALVVCAGVYVGWARYSDRKRLGH